MYEAKDERTFMILIAMQPLVADHTFMPLMKAMYLPFHMGHGSLIYIDLHDQHFGLSLCNLWWQIRLLCLILKLNMYSFK